MLRNSNLEAAINRDLNRLSSEYYSIVDLAREYNAPVLAMVDRQDLKYIKNKLSDLLIQIESLPEDDYKKRVRQEVATISESVSHSLLRHSI